tara:strand:+ start:313 stop:501 length:189 start_codon:yes stop_codon:yes gene_type:complete
MTSRAHRSLTAAGILGVFISILGYHMISDSPEPEPVVEDDDSAEGDDDSAPFSSLPPLPKEK